MSNLDMSLDQITGGSRARRGGGGGGRGGGRGGRPRQLRSSPYGRQGRDDDNGAWAHDKFASYENEFQAEEAGGAPLRGNRNNSLSSNGSDSGGFTTRGRLANDGGGEPSPKVLLSNLHFGVTSDDVKELLSSFGELISVRLNQDSGEAVAIFRRSADAAKAVLECDQRTLDGQVMSVRHAETRGIAGGRLAGRLGDKVTNSRAPAASAGGPTFTVSLSGASLASRGARAAGGARPLRGGGGGGGGGGSMASRLGGASRAFGGAAAATSSKYDDNETSGFGYRGSVAAQRGRGAQAAAAASSATAVAPTSFKGGARRGGGPVDASSLDADLDGYMAARN